MNGILLINKPKNWTSRDVVNKVSKIYKTKKVGHTGTLDPLATGVLVICIGKYTKLVSELTSLEKEYIATMKLGILTDTLDSTGTIIKEEKVQKSKEEMNQVFQKFPKEYEQVVPMYSAIKVKGKKLYEYAREGIKVELPKKRVKIKELEIINIQNDEITFKTTVSKGTYIRSLIRDLAANLNTIATMTSLERTKQGIFSIEECNNLDKVTEKTKLLTIKEIWDYPIVSLDEEEYKRVLNGNQLKLCSDKKKIFVSYQNEIIALYEKQEEMYKLKFFHKETVKKEKEIKEI